MTPNQSRWAGDNFPASGDVEGLVGGRGHRSDIWPVSGGERKLPCQFAQHAVAFQCKVSARARVGARVMPGSIDIKASGAEKSALGEHLASLINGAGRGRDEDDLPVGVGGLAGRRPGHLDSPAGYRVASSPKRPVRRAPGSITAVAGRRRQARRALVPHLDRQRGFR